MVEAIFISTIIFAVYVVYRTSDKENSTNDDNVESVSDTEPAAKAPAEPEPAAKAKPVSKPKPKAKPKAKPKKTEPVKKAEAAKPAPVPAPAPASKEVRNPDTGEVSSIPSNYRFTKRWIKDALVTEGLLDKVYKNNELDDEASAKVKEAMEQFRTIAKYHP